MSLTTYPRVCPRAAVDDVIEETCELCSERATATVRIEYNNNKKDDDVFDVCSAHKKAAHVCPTSFIGEYVAVTIEEVDDDDNNTNRDNKD